MIMDKTIEYSGVRTQLVTETRVLGQGDQLNVAIPSGSHTYSLEIHKHAGDDFEYRVIQDGILIINWQPADLNKLIALANQFAHSDWEV